MKIIKITVDGICMISYQFPSSLDTLLWTYRISCGKGQCKWRTWCLANLQSPVRRTCRPVCLLNIECIFEPNIERKKQRHSAYAYYNPPNTLDTERLSQNVEKAFSTRHDQRPSETGLWHSTYKFPNSSCQRTTDKSMLTMFLWSYVKHIPKAILSSQGSS